MVVVENMIMLLLCGPFPVKTMKYFQSRNVYGRLSFLEIDANFNKIYSYRRIKAEAKKNYTLLRNRSFVTDKC